MPKTRLKYHIIFVSKYRKAILSPKIMDFVIRVAKERLEYMGAKVIAIKGDDENHLHLMVELKPTQSVSTIVRHLKQHTAYYAWQEFGHILRKTYWHKNYFWSRGYFACTTGDASAETVRKYIESQGD